MLSGAIALSALLNASLHQRLAICRFEGQRLDGVILHELVSADIDLYL